MSLAHIKQMWELRDSCRIPHIFILTYSRRDLSPLLPQCLAHSSLILPVFLWFTVSAIVISADDMDSALGLIKESLKSMGAVKQ